MDGWKNNEKFEMELESGGEAITGAKRCTRGGNPRKWDENMPEEMMGSSQRYLHVHFRPQLCELVDKVVTLCLRRLPHPHLLQYTHTHTRTHAHTHTRHHKHSKHRALHQTDLAVIIRSMGMSGREQSCSKMLAARIFETEKCMGW